MSRKHKALQRRREREEDRKNKRTCLACGEAKDVNHFRSDKRTVDGIALRCEKCILFQKPISMNIFPDSDVVGERECSVCGIVKPLRLFCARHGRITSICRECRNEKARERRKESRQNVDNDEQKEKAKLYRESEKGKQTIKRGRRAYYMRNREKVNARSKVNYAVRTGKMVHPTELFCSCGNRATQYHHHLGYGEEYVFTVVPMCDECHNKIPKKRRKVYNERLFPASLHVKKCKALPESKVCGRCGKEKTRDEFGLRNKGGCPYLNSWCKDCQHGFSREWRSRPEVKVRNAAYMREYRARKKSEKQSSP